MTQIYRKLSALAEIYITKKNNFPINPIIEPGAFWTPIFIFFCLLLTATASYKATISLIEDNAWVVHTQEVIERTLKLASYLQTAESRQRGYLLSGDIQFLENYNQALQQAELNLRELITLIADNPVQQANLQQLVMLKAERVNAMQQVLESYQRNGAKAGENAFLANAGQQKMNDFMTLIEKMYAQEKKLLDSRSITSTNSKKNAENSLIIGAIFSISLVCFSYYLIIQSLIRSKQTAIELKEARDNLEIKVKERTMELELSNRELQEFAFIASHDLQEPLRKIQIFGDRLKQKSSGHLDDSAQDYLNRMQNAASRMHRLINDLLLFSQVSSKQGTFETVDLNIIVKDILDDLEGSIEYYQGHVAYQVLPIVEADPHHMRQLFQNIISNALKFHRPNQAPEVSVIWKNQTVLDGEDKAEQFYEICIIDNGIGIDPQYVDKIFVPFQRLHGRSEYEGTGIGLAICRKIIERHNGYIHVIPSPSGIGTMLIIGLPVQLPVKTDIYRVTGIINT
ncbi:MAG: CHASE3 domain-containing protein [Methylococcaceae bacterium]